MTKKNRLENRVREATMNAFVNGFLNKEYTQEVTNMNKGVQDLHGIHERFHSDYLSPTSTEHILDTTNQPDTANPGRRQALEQRSHQHQARHKTFNTPSHLDTSDITITTESSTPTNTTTKTRSYTETIAKGVGIASAPALLLPGYEATPAIATMTGAALGILYARISSGYKAEQAANRIHETFKIHRDKHFDSDTNIRRRIIQPLEALSYEKNQEKERLQTIATKTYNHPKYES